MKKTFCDVCGQPACDDNVGHKHVEFKHWSNGKNITFCINGSINRPSSNGPSDFADICDGCMWNAIDQNDNRPQAQAAASPLIIKLPPLHVNDINNKQFMGCYNTILQDFKEANPSIDWVQL